MCRRGRQTARVWRLLATRWCRRNRKDTRSNLTIILTIVYNNGRMAKIKEVAISEFKAKCLGLLEEVRKTRQPIRITRFGKPVAEVVPPSPGKPEGRRLGSMAGTGEILGDIVGPTGSIEDWDAWGE